MVLIAPVKALASDLAGQAQRRWRQEGPLTPIAC